MRQSPRRGQVLGGDHLSPQSSVVTAMSGPERTSDKQASPPLLGRILGLSTLIGAYCRTACPLTMVACGVRTNQRISFPLSITTRRCSTTMLEPGGLRYPVPVQSGLMT